MVDPRHFRAFSTHPDVRIVVDSCSDITVDIARRLGVDVIEFPFVVNGADCLDDQFETVSATDFYAGMRAGNRVLTSAIPTGRFVEIFEECAADGVPTMYLSLTAGLSSSVHDAQQAASMVRAEHPGFDLRVIDNCQPALSALMLAERACRHRDEGRDIEWLSSWVDSAKRRLHGYFTLDSLRWLAAGGRIPKAAASLGSVLDMKVNLTYDLDGALTMCGMSRGRKKSLKSLVSSLTEYYDGSPDTPIAICDAGCPDDADTLESMVRDALGEACPDILRLPLDPTIGAHVGPGMVAVSFWGVDRTDLKRGKR